MAIDPNAGAEPVLERCEVSAARSGTGELVLHLAGAWTPQNRIPSLDELRGSLEPAARPTCFPAELDNGDKFLTAATDNARSVANEARMPPPEKGRPSDYTERNFLGRLGAMIQRVQQENHHGKVVLDL